jgi:hypothetical protein
MMNKATLKFVYKDYLLMLLMEILELSSKNVEKYKRSTSSQGQTESQKELALLPFQENLPLITPFNLMVANIWEEL